MIKLLQKTTHMVKGRRSTGFWLPVTPTGTFPDEEHILDHGSSYPGRATDVQKAGLALWCQEDPGVDGVPLAFTAAFALAGVLYHVWVYAITKDTEGAWVLHSDDDFTGSVCQAWGSPDGRPQTFEIEGYEGEWIVVASPGF